MTVAEVAVLCLLGHHKLPLLVCIRAWLKWLDAMTIGVWCADGLLSVDDPQFRSSFTDVYNADSLQV